MAFSWLSHFWYPIFFCVPSNSSSKPQSFASTRTGFSSQHPLKLVSPLPFLFEFLSDQLNVGIWNDHHQERHPGFGTWHSVTSLVPTNCVLSPCPEFSPLCMAFAKNMLSVSSSPASMHLALKRRVLGRLPMLEGVLGPLVAFSRGQWRKEWPQIYHLWTDHLPAWHQDHSSNLLSGGYSARAGNTREFNHHLYPIVSFVFLQDLTFWLKQMAKAIPVQVPGEPCLGFIAVLVGKEAPLYVV